MSDVGGTTTDIGIVRNGRPTLTDNGANIGGWQTMVRAIDINTTGLGGDSEVVVAPTGRHRISLGPGRVVPLALLASVHPQILDDLRLDVADTRSGGAYHGRFLLRPFGTGPGSGEERNLTQHERTVLDLVASGPRPLRTVSTSLRIQRAIEALRRRGLVQLSGFTPSDAAHVMGSQSNWDRAASLLGAQLGARLTLMREPSDSDISTYAYNVWNEMVRSSALALFSASTSDQGGSDSQDSIILDLLATGSHRLGLVNFTTTSELPLIGVGGPASVFYPEAAKRFGAELILPRFGEVANAVGAATGVVTATMTATINGDGSGVFRAHAPTETKRFTDSGEALRWATEETRTHAVASVEAMGAPEPEVRIHTERTMMPGLPGDLGLLSATVTVEATGWPESFGLVLGR
jgi:N-methylhydantoinase A/oxoprolinase/acetone carboxylase beta subunit